MAGDVPWSLSDRTRALAEKGEFQAAMRLLPEAMAGWDEYVERTGETHEGARGFLYQYVMGLLVNRGDAEWGAILDDPSIPYGYKTEKYQIAMDVGEELFEFVRAQGTDVQFTACDSETCRWQLEHGTQLPSRHPIEFVAAAYGLYDLQHRTLTR